MPRMITRRLSLKEALHRNRARGAREKHKTLEAEAEMADIQEHGAADVVLFGGKTFVIRGAHQRIGDAVGARQRVDRDFTVGFDPAGHAPAAMLTMHLHGNVVIGHAGTGEIAV